MNTDHLALPSSGSQMLCDLSMAGMFSTSLGKIMPGCAFLLQSDWSWCVYLVGGRGLLKGGQCLGETALVGYMKNSKTSSPEAKWISCSSSGSKQVIKCSQVLPLIIFAISVNVHCLCRSGICAVQGSHTGEAGDSCAQVGKGWWLSPGWGWLCHTLQAPECGCHGTLDPCGNREWTSVTTGVWHLFVVQRGFLPCCHCQLHVWVWSVCQCSPQAAKPQFHKNGRQGGKGARAKTHPGWSVLGRDLPWKRNQPNPTNLNCEILNPGWVAFSVFPGVLGGRGTKRDPGAAIFWLSEENTDLSIFNIVCIFPNVTVLYIQRYKDKIYTHYILRKHISEEN